jgi:hypothetical protein
VAFDGLIHGYDLALSTGLAYEPPADVFAAVDSFAREALGADMRDGDTFALGTAAPEGASSPQAGRLQRPNPLKQR